MAILESKKGYSYNTETGERTNPDLSITKMDVENVMGADKLNESSDINLPDTPIETPTPAPTLTPLETESEKASKNQKTSETDYGNLLKQIGLIEGEVQTEAEKLGSIEARKEYDRYASEIALEERRMEKRRRELFSQGFSEEEARRAFNAEERISLETRADKAILGNAALGRYNTALEIAQSKVDAKLAPLKRELELKKSIFENNQDWFTTVEKTKLQKIISDDERKLIREENDKLESNKMIINAMQGKAPQSLISKAQELYNKGATKLEIADVLGGYALSPDEKLDLRLKEASLANIYSQIEERKNPTLTPAEQIKQNEILQQEKTKIDTFSNVALLANKLLNNKKLPRAVGLSTYTVTPGSEAFDFKQTANQLINTLAAANLDKMKGAMSDKDIQFLRNIESNLSLGMSEQGFRDELTRIMTSVTDKLKQDYGVDFKINMSDLSNDDLLNLPIQTEDNATFFNNL